MRRLIIATCTLFTIACAQAHDGTDKKHTHHHDAPEFVQVFKYDGSKQCEKFSGMSNAEMGQSLREIGIPVMCSYSSNDGMMRPQMCGHGTGNIHVYEIPAEKLSRAVEAGFKSVKSLKGFNPKDCQEKQPKKLN
ncbi:hypothetical protein [Alteromonas sp. a30]|uniref:hypothetical protein n=1 Tax=Alteromonas sp. a30 TaxID=2730917 RepID=UPI00228207E4|nr:hypothetical protein [Alteromonas sp. a30]MCY7295344.1 hypothetical protein [Alteromonas sp. a30]